MWPLPWTIGTLGCFLNPFVSLLFFFLLKKSHCNHSPSSDVQIFVGFFFFSCGSFLGLGNLAGETTAVWWPPSPSPYPLLPRIRKKPAPVYSGRKFPFSTQPDGARTLRSPFPAQQLCLQHRVGRREIGRALRAGGTSQGLMGSIRLHRRPAGQPLAHGDAAEYAAAGSSLPAHITPSSWCLPGIL